MTTDLKEKNRQVRSPSIQQMEAVECGAASLAMVLAYHGRWIPLEKLRNDAGVNRDGSNALKVLQAAKYHGMEGKGFRLNPDSLMEKVDLPAILHWGLNHFVVLDGHKNGTWFINDPANGERKKVPDEEFNSMFTGIVLSLTKGPNFKKEGSPPSVLAGIRPRLENTLPALTYAAIAGFLLAIPGLFIPGMSAIFVDQILVGGKDSLLGPILISLGILIALQIGLSWMNQYVLMRLQLRITLRTSATFFLHLLRLPMLFYHQRMAGDLIQRVHSNDSVAKLIAGQLASTAVSAITILLYGFVMFMFDWVLGLVAVVAATVNVLVMIMSRKVQIEQSRKYNIEFSKQIGTLMNGLQHMETLKAAGRENDFYSKWSGYQAKTSNVMQEIGIVSGVLGFIPTLVSTLVTLTILGIGGVRVINGDLSLGTLLAVQMLAGQFLGPVTQLMGIWSSLLQGVSDMNRLDDVLHYPEIPEIEDQKGEKGSKLISGHLELKNITFGYDKHSQPLITNFNLTLKPGTRVAIVGTSGSGKSTIAKMIAGLNDPWEGEIHFDGKPRNGWNQEIFCDNLSMIDQDVILFSGSIRDNIAVWDKTLPDEMIVKAAQDAQIHDVIVSRPGGYTSNIDEGGRNFSGGQRQRMEIARALSRNPRILILDEATSALDPYTEMEVDQAVRRRGCTCIVIAHRLSTIRDADEIVVLEKGNVVERGTHESLMENKGYYSKMVTES